MIEYNLQFFGGRGSAGGNKATSKSSSKTAASSVKKPATLTKREAEKERNEVFNRLKEAEAKKKPEPTSTVGVSFGKEPSASEYASLEGAYNKRMSGDGYKIAHTNLGFIGDYVTTPSGAKYTIIQTGSRWNPDYSIYTGRGYSSQQPTKEAFKTSEEALAWLKKNKK